MRYGKHCLSLNIIAALSIFMAIINQPLASFCGKFKTWDFALKITNLTRDTLKDVIVNNAEGFKNEFLLFYKLVFAFYILDALKGKEIKNKFIDKHIKKDNN